MAFMKLPKLESLILILPMLCMALLLSGCASLQNPNYPTLKQTDINVSWPMTNYRNASSAGRLTLAEKQRIDQAYAQYQAAYNQALQAAGGNTNAPTPDNVKALANQVIQAISATPMIAHTP